MSRESITSFFRSGCHCCTQRRRPSPRTPSSTTLEMRVFAHGIVVGLLEVDAEQAVVDAHTFDDVAAAAQVEAGVVADIVGVSGSGQVDIRAGRRRWSPRPAPCLVAGVDSHPFAVEGQALVHGSPARNRPRRRFEDRALGAASTRVWKSGNITRWGAAGRRLFPSTSPSGRRD